MPQPGRADLTFRWGFLIDFLPLYSCCNIFAGWILYISFTDNKSLSVLFALYCSVIRIPIVISICTIVVHSFIRSKLLVYIPVNLCLASAICRKRVWANEKWDMIMFVWIGNFECNLNPRIKALALCPLEVLLRFEYYFVKPSWLKLSSIFLRRFLCLLRPQLSASSISIRYAFGKWLAY